MLVCNSIFLALGVACALDTLVKGHSVGMLLLNAGVAGLSLGMILMEFR